MILMHRLGIGKARLLDPREFRATRDRVVRNLASTVDYHNLAEGKQHAAAAIFHTKVTTAARRLDHGLRVTLVSFV